MYYSPAPVHATQLVKACWKHCIAVSSSNSVYYNAPTGTSAHMSNFSSSLVSYWGDVQLRALYHQHLPPNTFQPAFNHPGSAVDIQNAQMAPTSPAPSPQPGGSHISDSRTQATPTSIASCSTKSKIHSKVSPPNVFIPGLPSLMANKDAWKVVVSYWQYGIPEHSVLPLCYNHQSGNSRKSLR
jgi:hypothetical protein